MEEGGYAPFDEAVRINKVGQVYDVFFMFKGKVPSVSEFFWPEVNRPTQATCRFYVEGSTPVPVFITFYLSHRPGNANYMVVSSPYERV